VIAIGSQSAGSRRFSHRSSILSWATRSLDAVQKPNHHHCSGLPPWSDWCAGRSLPVMANDYGLRVDNGNTSVVIACPMAYVPLSRA
jgi:hypothetical protein